MKSAWRDSDFRPHWHEAHKPHPSNHGNKPCFTICLHMSTKTFQKLFLFVGMGVQTCFTMCTYCEAIGPFHTESVSNVGRESVSDLTLPSEERPGRASSTTAVLTSLRSKGLPLWVVTILLSIIASMPSILSFLAAAPCPAHQRPTQNPSTGTALKSEETTEPLHTRNRRTLSVKNIRSTELSPHFPLSPNYNAALHRPAPSAWNQARTRNQLSKNSA